MRRVGQYVTDDQFVYVEIDKIIKRLENKYDSIYSQMPRDGVTPVNERLRGQLDALASTMAWLGATRREIRKLVDNG